MKACYDSQLGVREKTGRNDGERVEAYLKTTGLGKGYPWCGAFVNWVFIQAGVRPRAASPAQARSWFPKERLVERHAARQGDLFSLYYNSLGRIGHVGFIDQVGESSYITVEGNTNEAGSREGQGVYRKRRMKRSVYSVARWID